MPVIETVIIVCSISAILTIFEMGWNASRNKNGIHSNTVSTAGYNELIIDYNQMTLLSSIVNFINSTYPKKPSFILSVVSNDTQTLTTPLIESYELFNTTYGDIWIKTNQTNKTFDSFTICWKRSNTNIKFSNIKNVITNMS